MRLLAEWERESKDKANIFLLLDLSNWADSFRQKTPITSTSVLCSGSGLKEWVVDHSRGEEGEQEG